MILEVYITLFLISLALLFLGYYSEVDTIKILAYGLIFLLAVIIGGYGDNLYYKTGENISYTYGDNFTSYHWDYDFSTSPKSPTDAYLFHTTKVYNYATYENTILSFLMATLSFLGWLSVYFNFRRGD